MKTLKGKKEKIMGYVMSLIIGLTTGFMALGMSFAASPDIANSELERKQYATVWDAVEAQAEEADLRILSEYMDKEILARAEKEAGNICEVIKKYCEEDKEFLAIVQDYF